MTFKRLKVSKVFLRFFLSFFSVLIIPLSILGTISGKTIRDLMVENESKRNIAALSQCAEGIENELANISAIVFKASSEQDFSPYRMGDFTNNSRSVISLLKNYKTANNFIQDIYLFSPYSDYIFSTGTTYTYQRFITQKIPEIPSQTSLAVYLSEIAANAEYGYLPSSVDETVFLVFPLPSFGLTHYAYMIFEVPRKAFLSHFKLMAGSFDGNLMIFNHDVLLASLADCTKEMKQQLLQELYSSSTHLETGCLPAQKHRDPILFLKDGRSSLTYILTMPETDAMIQIDQVIRLFTFYLLFTALLGTFGIYLLAKINYSPIKRLAQSANGFWDNRTGSKPVDEIDCLYGYVKSSQSTYEKMNLELQDSLLATKYFFIKNLVNSHPYSPKEIQDMLKRASMHFHGYNFFVIIYHIHGGSPLTADIAEFLSYFHTEEITGYAAGLDAENIVGIYSCTPNGTHCIRKDFDLLHQTIGTIYQVSVTMGIGALKPDLSRIADSFLEASRALDCRFSVGENKLISFCDLKLETLNHSLKPPSLSDMAIRLVAENYAQPTFSVSSISEALGVSSSYLSHTFKEQQNITLNQYIKLYKMGLAKKMLAKTDDSLEKIIHLLGYYDCSSFIRMFKKHEGMTPGEYRRHAAHREK